MEKKGLSLKLVTNLCKYVLASTLTSPLARLSMQLSDVVYRQLDYWQELEDTVIKADMEQPSHAGWATFRMSLLAIKELVSVQV